MATVNIGNLTFTHKGDYASGTQYVKNDVVFYATNGNAYIAKQNTTGNAPTNGTYWSQFAAGSGGIWNAGLSLGSAGQSVKVNAAGNALEFGTISSGEYSVHKIQKYSYGTAVSGSGQQNYHDISGGNYLTFNPTSTNDFIFFSGHSQTYDSSAASGSSVYVMYGTATGISSGDTKVQYNGTHANYCGSTSDFYRTLYTNAVLPCSSLSAGTNYYAELAGSTHGTSNSTSFNNSVQDITTEGKHSLMLVHYKKT